MRNDDVVAADDYARVDGALRGDVAPDLLARLRLDGVNPPSPLPEMKRRVPLMVAITGEGYAVS